MSDDDTVRDFVVESYENLDRLDRELVGLEKNPSDLGALSSVFRTIHTIKGTCGFLGFSKLEAVAHVGENLLSRLRDSQITLNPEITTALLSMVDAVRQMLSQIETAGREGERDDSQLIAILTRLQQPTTAAQPSAAKAQDDVPYNAAPPIAPSPALTGDFEPAPPSVASTGKQPTAKKQKEKEKEAKKEEASHPKNKIPVEPIAAKPADMAESARAQQPTRVQASASESSIRVDVGLLEKVMNQVGELVLARNQVMLFANRSKDTVFLAASQRLNLITTELQEGVMKTRMQPIGNIWSQFPRTVRDVAVSCGKEVNIEMEGKETELDKTIIEAIKDPLTHLVRNSVDHGIELPEVRIKSGKERNGRLILRAYHEGGQVIIEISDDGAGLNPERIRKKAVERGLITSEQASRMPERDVFNLIFLPGFSTAEKVTNVSGRGVGMDVVKTNVEKIGGTVVIQSELGRGTTVRVKIPLTLAIIPALVVTCRGERYAIPQVSLLELVRLKAEEVEKKIELVHGAPVHRLRGRLLPLVYLERELGLDTEARSAENNGSVNIVVLQADDHHFGLLVDQINDSEEIVVKPLQKQLKTIKTFAGSTIMGDGKVALILDVLGLAQRSGVVSAGRDRALAEKAADTASAEVEKHTFLLFAGPSDSRMAIPLSMLARLEEFPVGQIEVSGNQWVTQYRGQILPLIRLAIVLEERRKAARTLLEQPPLEGGTIQVLVLQHDGKLFGLVVERILDIVEDSATVKSAATRASVLYSAVIADRVTELLDVPAILRKCDTSATGRMLAAHTAAN